MLSSHNNLGYICATDNIIAKVHNDWLSKTFKLKKKLGIRTADINKNL